jgi:hypothetical protein
MRRLARLKLGPKLRTAPLPVGPAGWCKALLLLLLPPSGPPLTAPAAATAKLEADLDVEADVETGKTGNPAASGEPLPEDAVLEGEGSWTPSRLACCV